MLQLKDGIHENITNADYHALPRVSNSDLTLFKSSPYDYYAWKLAEGRPVRKVTPAMERGTALHMAVLEPDLFKATYVEAPPLDRRTKAWKEFAESVEGKEILSAQEFAANKIMSDQIRKIPIIKQVLGEAKKEVTALWADEQTGLPCRARPDMLSIALRMIFDIKTTAELNYHAFSRSAINYEYHRQRFWYSNGLNTLLGATPEDGFDFCIVAVESSYPFKAGLFEFDEDLYSIAADEIRSELEELKKCMESGVWPTGLEGLNTIRAPEWMKKKIQKGFSYLSGDEENERPTD